MIAGNNSALLCAIENEMAKRVESYAVASIPNRFQKPQENAFSAPAAANALREKARIPLEWNPGSAISARALVIAAENRLGHVSEALLVCSPPSVFCAAADLKPVDIEVLTNDHVKSWLFLARELAASFKARGQGTLSLIYPEAASAGKGHSGDILGATAIASFRALALGLLAGASGEAYVAQGFAGGEAGTEAAFANFIFKQFDDSRRRTSGKLHKFGKPGFFK